MTRLVLYVAPTVAAYLGVCGLLGRGPNATGPFTAFHPWLAVGIACVAATVWAVCSAAEKEDALNGLRSVYGTKLTEEEAQMIYAIREAQK